MQWVSREIERYSFSSFLYIIQNNANKGIQFLVSVDHSRVKLSQAQDDDEGADYVNANYVPVSPEMKFRSYLKQLRVPLKKNHAYINQLNKDTI